MQGLLPTPKDDRDFKLGGFIQLPPLSDLPTDFVLEGYDIKNQQGSDMCSGFATAGMSGLQEGIPLSAEYAFAVGKELSGDLEEWGNDIRTALSAHTKIGTIATTDAPFSLENKERNFLADMKNWDTSFKEKALIHKKESYVKVTGNYDTFDNTRATIWKFRDEKRAVGFGCIFGWSSDQVILDTISQGFGHMMYVVGWRTVEGIPYLVVVNSWGNTVGDNGTHLMSRKVFNYYEDLYGAYMFHDMEPEELRALLDAQINKSEGWVMQLLKLIKTIIMGALFSREEKIDIIKKTDTALNKLIVPTIVVEPPKYLWDTVEHTRHSCRVIMDTYGFTPQIKDLLCAVIMAESGMKIRAINHNTNGSYDYGLVQMNSTYWVGKGKLFESEQEVYDHPEKSVKFICDSYKQGRLDRWYAYTNGSYKKYL